MHRLRKDTQEPVTVAGPGEGKWDLGGGGSRRHCSSRYVLLHLVNVTLSACPSTEKQTRPMEHNAAFKRHETLPLGELLLTEHRAAMWEDGKCLETDGGDGGTR